MTTIPLAPAPATTETRNRPPRRRLRDHLRRLDDVCAQWDRRFMRRLPVLPAPLRQAVIRALPDMLLYGLGAFLAVVFAISAR